MSKELFEQMAQTIIDGEEDVAAELAQKALDEGIDPLVAITEGYMPGVSEVGDSFACGNAFLPELVMAGEAMKAAIAILEPAMKASGTERKMLGKERKGEPRPGYDNPDPWYDGRNPLHNYTIVDTPRGGTVLAWDEIISLIDEYSEYHSRS